jgi:DNA helicase-2/ATP-dependent DNA helicase PcrA
MLDDASSARQVWYAPIVTIPAAPMRDFLLPVLQNYKLSATHVNNFLDVTHGGPKQFLLDTLLRFPHERGAAASYGSAIHEALQKAHNHVRATGQLQPEEDILHEFEKTMGQIPFTDIEHRHYLQQGTDALSLFLREKHASFRRSQQAELDFNSQDAYLDDVHLTGKLDVVEFDRDTMTATVTDYKTGGALTSWEKGDAYQKIKAHKYRQQLLFYKLLIEHSRDWRHYKMSEGILQFVEPDQTGAILDLRLGIVDPEELDRFTNLIQVIWRHIHDISVPDTSQYEPTIAGIRQFEDDLLTDNVK